MHRTGLKLIGVLIVIGLSAHSAKRLLPESSPVARGAAEVLGGECTNCHGIVDGSTLPGRLSANHPEIRESGDVEAYFEAVRAERSFPARARVRGNDLLEGERLARRYNCFQCHGELGQGGYKNPGALKGYIPGFFGDDFLRLTRSADRASVRDWIVNGVDPALLESVFTGAVADFFLERQRINMPSFTTLPVQELELLVSYVSALNAMGPMDRDGVREYLFATGETQLEIQSYIRE